MNKKQQPFLSDFLFSLLVGALIVLTLLIGIAVIELLSRDVSSIFETTKYPTELHIQTKRLI